MREDTTGMVESRENVREGGKGFGDPGVNPRKANGGGEVCGGGGKKKGSCLFQVHKCAKGGSLINYG